MQTTLRRTWVERSGKRRIPSNVGTTLMGGPGNERVSGGGGGGGAGGGNSTAGPVGAVSYFTGAAPVFPPIDTGGAAFSYSLDGSQPARTWDGGNWI